VRSHRQRGMVQTAKRKKAREATAMARPSQSVLVVDFGAQYSQLIARRVRECKVYCEIVPPSITPRDVRESGAGGLILSGGPDSVHERGAVRCDPGLFDLGLPVLGICYGMQLMAETLGGKTGAGSVKEYGKTELQVADSKHLFSDLNPNLICWMSHGDSVLELPQGFDPVASTRGTPIAAMENQQRRLYGVQFHPEVVHTPWGIDLMRNFLYKECACEPIWTMESYISQATREIKELVGDKRVLCALSGGVDSSTTAAIVHRAIGHQLTCIFVNHGFLRKEEAERVLRAFKGQFDINIIYIDAEERFLAKLAGVRDPEKKRSIVGEEFIRVFEEEARKLGDIDYLAQGTLYPDVIESGTAYADTIKSHHNVGGLPSQMGFELIEPLRSLFKDEVRTLAAELGLSSDLTWRQPFPGPGLAIRILGEVTKARCDLLREADWIVIDEIKRAGLYRELFQSFAVLIPARSVGVMGDRRTYGYTIVVRCVTAQDAMTADWARLPYDVLERISNRIMNEVKGVNRVVYDVSQKPPATIEWE
jgi:GMP synthase (glutamine-hydrolysing)